MKRISSLILVVMLAGFAGSIIGSKMASAQSAPVVSSPAPIAPEGSRLSVEERQALVEAQRSSDPALQEMRGGQLVAILLIIIILILIF